MKTKLILLTLAQLSAVILVSCKYKESWSIKKDLPKLGFQLKHLTKNVRSVIKQYVSITILNILFKTVVS